MTTSPKMPLPSELKSDEPLSPFALSYFRARTKGRLYDLVLTEFLKKEAKGFTRAKLARRIRKKPEVITRLLGAPGNWTMETVSDLLLGIGALELDPIASAILEKARSNRTARDLLFGEMDKPKTPSPTRTDFARASFVTKQPSTEFSGTSTAQVRATLK